MAGERQKVDLRVLLLAPTFRDGQATSRLLASAHIGCLVCDTLEQLCDEAALGAAVLVVPEQALLASYAELLVELVRRQPVWSDLPVIVLASARAESPGVERALATLASVSVIERPMRVNTFLSVVRTALAARERQYQVRDHLEERRRVEQTLARDAILLANVRDSVILTDVDGIVTYWNEGATRLFGSTATEMLGRPLVTRLPEPSRTNAAQWILKIAAGDAEFEGEWLDVRKDGSPVWIEVATRLIRDETGAPLGIMGLAHDITERKSAEAERERLLAAEQAARSEAERASRAKDDFLAALSHELRTPLSPVLLTISLMESNPDLPEALRTDVATIRRNVELESRLIGDLLDLTRIARGKMELDMQEVDLHQTIASAIDICRGDGWAQLNIELHAREHVVQGDPTRLQQIFWNLLNNAQKFTPPDGQITVRSSDVPGGLIRVEVSDTGRGIAPDLLPRLFDAFEQGEAGTARQQAGLGLGLTISKNLAEAHGGTITARSDGLSRGATMIIELPTFNRAALATRAPTARESLPARFEAPTSLSILLVEDHDATARAMTRLLARMGHRVTHAASVASALRHATLHGFDLMLCDLGLPDGSGLDVMQQLGAELEGRAIALTGYGMEADIVATRKAGFTEHLTKPVDGRALEAAIRRVSGRAGAGRERPEPAAPRAL